MGELPRNNPLLSTLELESRLFAQDQQIYLNQFDLLPNAKCEAEDHVLDWISPQAGVSLAMTPTKLPPIPGVQLESGDIVIQGSDGEDRDHDGLRWSAMAADRTPLVSSPDLKARPSAASFQKSTAQHSSSRPARTAGPAGPDQGSRGSLKRPALLLQLSPETSPRSPKRPPPPPPSPPSPPRRAASQPSSESSSWTSLASMVLSRPSSSSGKSGGAPRFRCASCPCCHGANAAGRGRRGSPCSPPLPFRTRSPGMGLAVRSCTPSGLSELSTSERLSVTSTTTSPAGAPTPTTPGSVDGGDASVDLSLSDLSSGGSTWPPSSPPTPRHALLDPRPSLPELDLVARSVFTDHDYQMLEVGDIVEIHAASDLSDGDVIMTPDSLDAAVSSQQQGQVGQAGQVSQAVSLLTPDELQSRAQELPILSRDRSQDDVDVLVPVQVEHAADLYAVAQETSELAVDVHALTEEPAKLAVDALVSSQHDDALDEHTADLRDVLRDTSELAVGVSNHTEETAKHLAVVSDQDAAELHAEGKANDCDLVLVASHEAPAGLARDAGQSESDLARSTDSLGLKGTLSAETEVADVHTKSLSDAAVHDLSRTLSNASLQDQDDGGQRAIPRARVTYLSYSSLSSKDLNDEMTEKQCPDPTVISPEVNFQFKSQDYSHIQEHANDEQDGQLESSAEDDVFLHINTSADLFENVELGSSPTSLVKDPTMGLNDSFEHVCAMEDQRTSDKKITLALSSNFVPSNLDILTETSCTVEEQLLNSSQKTYDFNDQEWIVDMERETLQRFTVFESSVPEELPEVILEDDDDSLKQSENCLGSQNQSKNVTEENNSDEHQLSSNSSLSSSPSRDLDALSLTQCHPQKRCAVLKRKKVPTMKRTRRNWEQWYKQFKTIVTTGKQKLKAQTLLCKERNIELGEENKENIYQQASSQSDQVLNSVGLMTNQEPIAAPMSLISNCLSLEVKNREASAAFDRLNQSKWSQDSQDLYKTNDFQVSNGEACSQRDSDCSPNTSAFQQQPLFRWNPDEPSTSNPPFQHKKENIWNIEESLSPRKSQRSVVRVGLSKRAKLRPLHIRKQWWVSKLWSSCSIL